MSQRILFITSGLGVGGAERALERLLPELQKRGHACAVLSLREPQEVGQHLRAAGIPVFELGMSPSRPNLCGLWNLWRIARNFRPDVLQGWMYHGDIAAQLARVVCPGAKVVLGVHQTLARLELESKMTRLVIRADAWLSCLSTHAVYVAHAAQVQHEAAGFRAKGTVLPNGIDTEQFKPDALARRVFRESLGIGRGEMLVGMVGRFHPAKNHAGFLRAAATVAERRPDARFVLIGAGVTAENPDLVPLLDNAALRGKVHLLGAREDVSRCLPGFDLAVLSSVQEALPNVVAEAMSCGIPCVVTDVGDAALMVGETGWVVPPQQDEALAASIVAALEKGRDGLRIRADKARLRAEKLFSHTQVAEHYERFYRSL